MLLLLPGTNTGIAIPFFFLGLPAELNFLSMEGIIKNMTEKLGELQKLLGPPPPPPPPKKEDEGKDKDKRDGNGNGIGTDDGTSTSTSDNPNPKQQREHLAIVESLAKNLSLMEARRNMLQDQVGNHHINHIECCNCHVTIQS